MSQTRQSILRSMPLLWGIAAILILGTLAARTDAAEASNTQATAAPGLMETGQVQETYCAAAESSSSYLPALLLAVAVGTIAWLAAEAQCRRVSSHLSSHFSY